MITSVSNQAYVFLCTIVGGMAIALLYDVFRILRKAIKTGIAVTYVQDFLYWIIAAAIMFLTVYFSNDGQLRAYLFAGAVIGAILYALLLSKIIMKCSLFIINAVIYPVRMLVHVLKRLTGWLCRVAREYKKTIQSSRNK